MTTYNWQTLENLFSRASMPYQSVRGSKSPCTSLPALETPGCSHRRKAVTSPANLEGKRQSDRALLTLTFRLPFFLPRDYSQEGAVRLLKERGLYSTFRWLLLPIFSWQVHDSFLLSDSPRRSRVWQEQRSQNGKSPAHHHTIRYHNNSSLFRRLKFIQIIVTK